VASPGMNPSLHGAVDLSGLVRRHQAPAPTPTGDPGGISRSVDDSSIGEVVELSQRVPVILEVVGGDVAASLQSLVEGYAGRFAYASVRAEAAPELVKALQLPGLPVVLALLGGQPVPLFQGIPPEAEIRPVLDQVLELAAKNGITGVLEVSEPPAEAEAELPLAHQDAYDALARNDIPAAKAAFHKALTENPRDQDAEAGLAQVELLERVSGVDPVVARQRAADNPEDLAWALVVADLDMVSGHSADAFHRLLTLFSSLDSDARDLVRTRLLSYFLAAGQSTDEVKRARTHLANLMF